MPHISQPKAMESHLAPYKAIIYIQNRHCPKGLVARVAIIPKYRKSWWNGPLYLRGEYWWNYLSYMKDDSLPDSERLFCHSPNAQKILSSS